MPPIDLFEADLDLHLPQPTYLQNNILGDLEIDSNNLFDLLNPEIQTDEACIYNDDPFIHVSLFESSTNIPKSDTPKKDKSSALAFRPDNVNKGIIRGVNKYFHWLLKSRISSYDQKSKALFNKIMKKVDIMGKNSCLYTFYTQKTGLDQPSGKYPNYIFVFIFMIIAF